METLPVKTTLMARRITSAILAVSLATVSATAFAGKIIAVPSAAQAPNAPTFVADGFGGWNLGNIEIVLTGTLSWFNETDGSYFFDPADSDFTYLGEVDDDLGTTLGYVLAKDWPVGEPSGIKIVNDDLDVKPPKPQNCIMATSYLEDHFLDTTDPQQVPCSGPFQSHKRYKLAMLPSSVAGGTGLEQGIDLVFNVEDEAGSRDYQVFQKINNWTDVRLSGFKVEVGTGIGIGFTKASSGVGVANLSLSVPAEVWDFDQLAIFSAGLFGPPDPHHDRDAGYFDPNIRAGFHIDEYPNISGATDTLTATRTLGSDYAEIPPGSGTVGQFGPWLPSIYTPEGLFWDDDGNPETDAELLAWYGLNPALDGGSGALGWMTGAAGGFAEVPAATIEAWGENLEYTSGVIDDLVNVGLFYIVSVGDVAGFPGATFTIRVTPTVDTSGVGAPPYYGATPTPGLIFGSSNGVVSISPVDEFVPGSILTARVGDADLNVASEALDEVTVAISAIPGPSDTLTLIEQGENRGVFAATLPDAFSEVPVGTVVTVTYLDVDDGNGGTNVTKSASTTAVEEIIPPPVVDVSITDFSVPSSLFVGQTAKAKVIVQNARESEETIASGRVIIKANGTEVENEEFTDLAPNKKLRVSTNWVVPTDEDINWTVSLEIDSEVVDTADGLTEVSVKPGNKNGNN